uniref:MIF4G domain-containing protein n=1 Tax=Panagrolaimus sp. PS1159 TaxID=55785 RepID=A0AC35GS25_9BILA
MVSLCEKRSENAWVPYFLKHNNDINNNNENIVRAIRGVLNKLATKKFDALVQDLTEIDLWCDKETFIEMISVIFEQAMQSPLYGSLYADLCLKIQQNENDLNKAETWFHRGLVRKIQTLVEAVNEDSNTEIENEDLLRKMKKKRDLIGLIRFISQLFRVNLINFKILENCLVTYVRAYERTKKELFLESAILLLYNAGPFIRDSDGRAKFDGYSSYCEKYRAVVCKRINFMIDDLVNLRESNWGQNV